MFCNQCGKETENNQRFCSQCGATLSKAETASPIQNNQEEKLIYTVQPCYLGMLGIVQSLNSIARFSIGITLFFLLAIAPRYHVQLIHILIGCGVGLIVPVIIFWYMGLKNNQATYYHFFDNHIEYQDKFFGVEKNMIRYSNFTEMQLNKTIIQQLYGVGSIIINTANGNLVVRDLKNYQEIYEFLQKKYLHSQRA